MRVFDPKVLNHFARLVDENDGVFFARPIQSAKGPVLLPLLGVIHGLLLLFVVFTSLCPAIHLADITAFRRRLSMRCRSKGLRLDHSHSRRTPRGLSVC